MGMGIGDWGLGNWGLGPIPNYIKYFKNYVAFSIKNKPN